MIALPASSSRPPRLNPFAFPSDTDFRFILLVVAVLAVSLFMYNWVYLTVNRDEHSRRLLDCSAQRLTAARAPQSRSGTNSLNWMDEQAALARAYNRCMAPVMQKQTAWKLGGGALLLLVASVIYWFFPAWKMRRESLEPLTAEDAPDVLAGLRALCQQTGVTPMPQFVWNPLHPTVSALAFGRLGRYYVALSGGLVTRFSTDRPAFDATVRHELAHIRNADVDKTYITVAITWAFVVAAVVPFAVTLLMRFASNFAFGVTWRVAALIALVYLIRNAFLRAREMYADVRAATWDGSDGALDRVLGQQAASPTSRWRSLWLTHPTPTQRRLALADPRLLLRFGFWEALGVGAVTALALRDVEDLLSAVITDNPIATVLSSALVFTPLIVGVVGLGAWRATYARVVEGQSLPSVIPWALGLGVGLVLGRVLALGSALSTQELTGSDLSSRLGQAAFTLVWAVVVTVGLFLFLRWLVAVAADWLRVTLGDASPWPVYGAGLILAAIVLAVWLGPLYVIALWADLFGALIGLTMFGVSIAGFFGYLSSPVLATLFVALWAYPLASAFWRRPAAPTTTSGTFLDQAPPLTVAAAEPVRLRPLLLLALLLGLVYFGAALAIRFTLGVTLPQRMLTSEGVLLAVAYGLVGLAAIMQAGLAFYVAARSRRQPVTQAMFAAFVAAVGMSVGFLVVTVLRGGSLNSFFVQTIASSMVNYGAVLSLPAALLGHALASRWPRVKPARASASALDFQP